MNCIIIEDEAPAQEILNSYIERIPDLNLLGVFNGALQANAMLQSGSIDLVFLDINLPDISGMSFVKALKKPPMVVMTTAYSHYAVESFEYEAIVDYLVKPFDFERFLKSVNKAEGSRRNELPAIKHQSLEEVSKNDDYVFVNVDKMLHKIMLGKIIYIQSERNYVTIVTTDIKLSFIDTLKNWTRHLEADNFIQVHKSFILNADYIEKLTGSVVYVHKQKIPVGKTFKEALMNKVKPLN